MNEIVVVSGKGGTGKTSLTACFAYLAKGSVLADCDVDAPNLHLLASPEIQMREDFISGHVAVISKEDCTSCRTCMDLCHFDAVREDAADGGGYRIDVMDCEGCGVCAWFCPEEAIRLEESHAGEWYISRTRFGPMVHAALSARGENSGKLVTVIREKARQLAQERGAGLILIDGPPGIGCPVNASLANTDLVVLVTEPTLSGKHDLERICELVTHFQQKSAVIINRFDVNPEMADKIETWCRIRGFPLLGKIPYDRGFMETLSQGKCLVELSEGTAAREVRATWSKLLSIAGMDLCGKGENNGTKQQIERIV